MRVASVTSPAHRERGQGRDPVRWMPSRRSPQPAVRVRTRCSYCGAGEGGRPRKAPSSPRRRRWPGLGLAGVSQPVSAGFDEQRNKGLDFAGKPGDPVLAVADGRVVYAGSGLRGYGNLVIIKHNNTYLTAYAHNRAMLVEQDQVVRKGQRIAEMGSTESDTVKLHFEVRKLGKPVDPAKLLPAR